MRDSGACMARTRRGWGNAKPSTVCRRGIHGVDLIPIPLPIHKLKEEMMSIPQNRSTHQGPEAFRETVRRITEEIQNNHRPGYGVQIPQSLLETDLPSMAIAIRNVGRFAVVLDPATAASGDGPSHQSAETTSQSASASPLAAIGAAIIYQSVLHHRTRCYAEVMPVLALEGRIPDDSLLRAADRLDVQVVMYHQSVISELERLSRLVHGHTRPASAHIDIENVALMNVWQHR